MKCLEKVIEEIAAERDALRDERDMMQDAVISRDMTIDALRAKLATLKQAQEPVAWYDPTNANPGQSVTFFKADRDRWPHLYPVPLCAAPKPGEPA